MNKTNAALPHCPVGAGAAARGKGRKGMEREISVGGKRAGKTEQQTRDAIEREVQRRVTAILSSGGVGYSMISQEVLYLLPTDFVRAYTRLYYQAFQEPVRGSGMGSGNPDEQKVRVKSGTAGERMMSKATGKPVGKSNSAGQIGVGHGGGGKRYKTYWSVKDTRALAAKARFDRRLKRLAKDLAEDMGWE